MHSFLPAKTPGISASTIKIIAMVSMLIDHTGATIIKALLQQRESGSLSSDYMAAASHFLRTNADIHLLYQAMRLIGRIAFPIFCFLLVEGMEHTHNRWKYARNLFLFALLSEFPFDLALHHRVFDLNKQNVFFTLLIGLFTMMMLKWIHEKMQFPHFLWFLPLPAAFLVSGITGRFLIDTVVSFLGFAFMDDHFSSDSIRVTLFCATAGMVLLLFYCRKWTADQRTRAAAMALTVLAGMLLARLLHTDYSDFGILTISAMYLLRYNRMLSVQFGCLLLTLKNPIEISSFFILLPISQYNGTRGLRLKYVFYAFYPVHLLLLHGICLWLHLE